MANSISNFIKNFPNHQRTNWGIDMSQFSKFPWLNQEYIDEIERRTKDVPELYKDSMQQQMYSDYYQKQQIEEQQSQRTAIKNQARQNSINSSDPNEKKWLNMEIRKADLADIIRRKYSINTQAGNDDVIIEKFISQVPNWTKLYGEYIEWKNSNLLSKSWIISPVWAELNERNKVNPYKKDIIQQEDTQETNLISSSNFDNDEYANQYLKNQSEEYSNFIDQAKSKWYSEWEIASIIDASKKYQEYLKQVEDFKDRPLDDKIWIGWEVPVWFAQGFTNFFINTYNNLLWENETVWAFKPVDTRDVSKWFRTDYDPTWQMRANSWWTKWGNIAWGVTAWILTDAALLKLLPWMEVENLTAEWIKQVAKEWGKEAVKQAVVDRTIQWAAQWGLWGFVGSVSTDNPVQSMKYGIPIWMWAWALVWYVQGTRATNKAKASIMDELDELKKSNPETKEYVDIQQKDLRNKYEKWVKPSWRWKKTTADYQKSIDDGLKWTEVIVKNKDGLQFIDADGDVIEWQLPKNNEQFSEAIRQTKKNIYDQYHQKAIEAWQKNVGVSTKSAVEELTKLRDDKVALAWNDGLKWKIQQRIDDLTEIDGMSPEDAERKIAELNRKLEAFSKNWTSNDVSNDALNFLIKNNLKKSLDDAIEDALGEWNTYQSLKRQYSYLRNIEKDVNQRALVQARRNGVGLVDSIANIESAEDFVKALAWSKESASSFLIKQWLKKWISWRNNPDTYIKELFNEVDNIVNQSENRADLYNRFGSQITEEVIQRAWWDISKIELILWSAWDKIVDWISEQDKK